jgi:hypothetical protein
MRSQGLLIDVKGAGAVETPNRPKVERATWPLCTLTVP